MGGEGLIKTKLRCIKMPYEDLLSYNPNKEIPKRD